MKFFLPQVVTAGMLTTNVVETAPAVYNAGTTYALGATAHVDVGLPLDVYQSLQNANTGHTPASSPTWWKKIGTTYPVYSGATWALGDIVIDATGHRTYESLQGSNTGHTPGAAGSETWWLDIGPTNRWSMHDGLVQTQTTNPDTITESIALAERIDYVVLLNCAAASVHIVITDTVDGVVLDTTYDMASSDGITDHYPWWFTPPRRRVDLIASDLPPYGSGATLAITLTDTGATVACGALLMGLSEELGDEQFGAEISIDDFSVKTTDAFGNFQITERAFSRKGSFPVRVPAGMVDGVIERLSELRATPVVYIASPLYTSTVVYGYYSTFTMGINYWNYSDLSIETRGLT